MSKKHRDNKLTLSKSKLKKRFRYILTAEIPDVLVKKYHGHIIAGVIVILIGIISMFVLKSLSFGLFPIIIGMLIVMLGLLFKSSVLKGYIEVEGVIIERTHLIPTIKTNDVADGFIVLTNEQEQIRIPATKRKNSLRVGTKLKIYISEDTNNYTFRGVTNYGNILGYEVLDFPSNMIPIN